MTAAAPDRKDPSPSTPATPVPAPPQERIVTTEHRLKVGKQTLAYTATCGTLVLHDYDPGRSAKDGERSADKPRAALFFTAYTLKVDKKPSASGERPVTFSFNGGPGSSSVWLHLGILGPQRVAADEMGNAPPPPYALVDNQYT